MSSYSKNSVETNHEDMVHDAQLDYYGKKLATCSSDKRVKIFLIDGDTKTPLKTLEGHEGPVWQVAWAHPKFGNILASCSYDGKVIIWKEQNSEWIKIHEHALHTASVNSISWAPHELGPVLACASSDGKISVLTFKDDGKWDVSSIDAHNGGANSVSWSPATIPGALVHGASNVNVSKKFASGGCDNHVKIWTYREDTNEWKENGILDAHTDWVRDVAWAPNVGLQKNYLASCSQDKSVYIWTKEAAKSEWEKKLLRNEKFPDVVWRVSWSLSGNILAVSCGDNKVTLYKENLKGEWDLIEEMVDS